MSTIRMGWETWLAWAPETNIGTANLAAVYLWEGEGGAADSLDLGYQRSEGRPVSGYRATQAQTIPYQIFCNLRRVPRLYSGL